MTGFTSKRQAALDKLFEVENELGLHYDQRTPMTKDEALTLEALKYAASMGHGGMVKDMFAPFTIKSTLAQPAQEPVAWMSPSWIDPDTRGWQSDSFESIPIEGWLPIYTAPPQRPWVGLTAEEAAECWTTSATQTWHNFESALRSKNT